MAGNLTETEARKLVAQAVHELGGERLIVGSPRHPPFAIRSTESLEVEGRRIVIHFGEMSSPAIAVLGRWVFEIKEEGLLLLDGPRRDDAT